MRHSFLTTYEAVHKGSVQAIFISKNTCTDPYAS